MDEHIHCWEVKHVSKDEFIPNTTVGDNGGFMVEFGDFSYMFCECGERLRRQVPKKWGDRGHDPSTCQKCIWGTD